MKRLVLRALALTALLAALSFLQASCGGYKSPTAPGNSGTPAPDMSPTPRY